MRWLVPLMGILTLSCLPPHSESVDPVPEIFLDFPELAQWGNVVSIGGREYWRPDRAHFVLVPAIRLAAPPHDAWMPYGNGYFHEDALDGLVWVSYDPWGFITTHYGYWRHHEQLGYLWRPLYPLTWRPFVATILHDERGFIFGICPFSMLVWESGLYDLGFGFDDAYWAPYWSRVDAYGFYAHHRQRFDGYWVSVTLYEEDLHWRDEPESHSRRDREYRERRRHPGSRNDGSREDHPRDAEVSENRIVGEGLPARPVASPPAPERGGDDRSPPAPAGLPTIPRRDLNPPRQRETEQPAPRLPLDTEELRPVPPGQPTRPATSAPAREGTVEGPVIEPQRQDPPVVERGKKVLPVIQPTTPLPPSAPEEKNGSEPPASETPDAVGAKRVPSFRLEPKGEAAPTPPMRPARDSVAVPPAEAAQPSPPDRPEPSSQKKDEASEDARGKPDGKSSESKERAKNASDARSKEKKR